MTTGDAGVLREAARVMRARAEAATPGPWRAAESPDSPHRFQAVVAGDLPIVNCGAVTGPTGHPQAADDAAHIAAFASPAVALAAADLLDDMAETADLIAPGGDLGSAHWTMHGHIAQQKAVAFATAYLGEPSP